MPRTLTVSLKSQSVTLTITLTLGCSRGGVVVSVHVGVNVSGVGVPFRVGLVLDRNHAAGQGAAATPVASKEPTEGQGVSAAVALDSPDAGVAVAILLEDSTRLRCSSSCFTKLAPVADYMFLKGVAA